MKKLIVLCLCIYFNSNSFAQEFPLKSSEWYISNLGGTVAKDTYLEVINYEKDTIVFGVTARKLSNGMVFHYRNDSVFSMYNGGWGLLYDFNAIKGDTIEIAAFPTSSPSVSTLQFVIDSVENQVFGNDTIQVFHNHFVISDYQFYNDRYTRRIGANYFFPIGDLVPEHNYIRCYIDSTISINNSNIPCEQGNPFSVDEVDQGLQYSIYPNPASGNLTIQIEKTGNYKVDIYNVLGDKILVNQFTGNRIDIDLSKVDPGMYFIQLYSDQYKSVISKKILIE